MYKNVQKAINTLESLEIQHLEYAEKLQEKVIEWPHTLPLDIALELVSTHKEYATNMALVMSLLKDNGCNHPKEMIGICGDMKYCMDCNLDLGKVK